MPDWLINLIVQYPVAALNGLVVWYTWKQVQAREAELQKLATERETRLESRLDQLSKDLREAAEKEIQRSTETIKEETKAHLASKDAEIDRLAKLLVEELKKLAKKIDDQTKKKPD